MKKLKIILILIFFLPIRIHAEEISLTCPSIAAKENDIECLIAPF